MKHKEARKPIAMLFKIARVENNRIDHTENDRIVVLKGHIK